MAYAFKAKELLSSRKYGVTAYQSIGSTNIEAKKIAKESGDAHVIIADTQTDGRGRLGRSFYSPEENGIYLSYIKQLNDNAENLPLLTSFAGLAVCRACESLLPRFIQPLEIKWPNDIYIDGKKICGILTNLLTDTKKNKISHAIIGIGLNVNSSYNDFPDDLKSKAGSIYSQTGVKISCEDVCNAIVLELDKMFFDEKILEKPQPKLTELLKSRSYTIGKMVEFECDGKKLKGRATDINNDGSLKVAGMFGTKNITTGEAVIIL